MRLEYRRSRDAVGEVESRKSRVTADWAAWRKCETMPSDRRSFREAAGETNSKECRETADSVKRRREEHAYRRYPEIDGHRLLVADLGHSEWIAKYIFDRDTSMSAGASG